MPNTTKTSPAADSTAPVTSKAPFVPFAPENFRPMTMMPSTTRTWAMKDARQLIALVMRPPIKGPAAAPNPAAALTRPKALARDSRSANATVRMM